VRGSGGGSPGLLDVCPEKSRTDKRERRRPKESFFEDGRRSSGAGMQIQASNHPWVLKIHVFGAERIGKRLQKQSGAYHGAKRK